MIDWCTEDLERSDIRGEETMNAQNGRKTENHKLGKDIQKFRGNNHRWKEKSETRGSNQGREERKLEGKIKMWGR